MTTIMHRSFAEHMGFNWPKEIAYTVRYGPGAPLQIVTFAQLLAERKKKQAEHLRRVLECRNATRRAGFVWTFYQPGLFGFVYSGWWLYIRTLGKDWGLDFRVTREEPENPLTRKIMELWPCGLLPLQENFGRWKEAFGKAYARPGRSKKQGLRLVWVDIDRYGDIQDVVPA